MSDTAFSISYQGAGATLYAIVREATAWTVWNGTALVSWVNGNIGTYDIPLTDRGGDFYSVAVPAALPAGDYRILYYEQAGGAPAITDLLLGTELRHWDGAVLSSSSTVTLSAYALTTLDSAKRHQGITSSTYDTILTELINSISAQIERISGVLFAARDYRERINGKWQQRIILQHHPVQRVTKVIYGSANAMTLSYTGAGIDATASVYDDPESSTGYSAGLRLTSVAASGVEAAASLTFATYPSVSTLVAAVSAVSGWTATTLVDGRSCDLYATGGEDALSRTVTLTYPDRKAEGYRLDSRTGSIEFDRYGAGWEWWWTDQRNRLNRHFPYDFQGLHVLYRAGYETVPYDVQLLCNQLVKEAYLLRTQNTALQSEKLGDYSVTYLLSANQQQRVRAELAYYVDGARLIGGAF